MFKPLTVVLVAVAGLVFQQTSFGMTNYWVGPGTGSNLWSAGGNWSAGSPPGPDDYVKFTDKGTSFFSIIINNVVNNNLTIGTLYYANTNGFHSTLIYPGGSLVVTSNLIAGVDQFLSVTPRTNVIQGNGSSLIVSNAAAYILIRDLQGPTAGQSGITLDMSGLDSFTAIVGNLSVGNGTVISNASGGLILARNNSITVEGATTPAILVGAGSTNLSSLSGAGTLLLGQSNRICADSIAIGVGLTSARLAFNTNFSNPVASFRGQDGSARVTTFNIGDGLNFSSIPTVDFSAGTVDLQADVMEVGRTLNDSESNLAARGALNFDKGNINVNTLVLGLNTWTNYGFGEGYVNVRGTAKLVINSALEMGKSITTNGYPSSRNRNRGVLNISGGTVLASVINANYFSASNVVTMTNGILVITNSMGPGIFQFTMVDSALTLPAGNSPSAIVTNFITGGSGNVINIGALNGLNTYPTQVALIKYTGTIGGSGFNLGLGSLPGPTYTGYLSNNLINHSVDLVLSRRPFLDEVTASGGQFSFNVAGASNGVVNILTSTNLTSWELLTTVTNTTGNTSLQYPTTTFPQQFFRAQETE